MSGPVVSMVSSATQTETRDANSDAIISSISGGKWRTRVEPIRAEFRRVLDETGDRTAAKRAVDKQKKQLAAVMWSGSFSRRANGALTHHSGLMCADLDALGDCLPEVREKLPRSPHLWALFLSPTGDGLKAVFRVPCDAATHMESFRAVEQHVRELTGVQIDQACKDAARLCFVSDDPDAYHHAEAMELPPLDAEAAKPKAGVAYSRPEIETRRSIATDLLGEIRWGSDTHGFCTCPAQHLHESENKERDCEVYLDKVPTIHCFHCHCKGVEAGVNHE